MKKSLTILLPMILSVQVAFAAPILREEHVHRLETVCEQEGTC